MQCLSMLCACATRNRHNSTIQSNIISMLLRLGILIKLSLSWFVIMPSLSMLLHHFRQFQQSSLQYAPHRRITSSEYGKSNMLSRDHSVYAPSQWETALQCNTIFHWLGIYTKWSPAEWSKSQCWSAQNNTDSPLKHSSYSDLHCQFRVKQSTKSESCIEISNSFNHWINLIFSIQSISLIGQCCLKTMTYVPKSRYNLARVSMWLPLLWSIILIRIHPKLQMLTKHNKIKALSFPMLPLISRSWSLNFPTYYWQCLCFWTLKSDHDGPIHTNYAQSHNPCKPGSFA